MYLNPIITKVLTDTELINQANSLREDDNILKFLMNNGINKNTIMSWFKSHYGVEYIDLEQTEINTKLLKLGNIEALKYKNVLPYRIEEDMKRIYFVITDILNLELCDDINIFCNNLGYSAIINFATREEIDKKYHELENYNRLSGSETETVSSVDNNVDGFDVIGFVDKFINQAIEHNASDIHMEPLENGAQIRYRIDGSLTNKEHYDISNETYKSIVVRVKIISGMNIAEKRKAQDGRIKDHIYQGKKYDMRVSSVSGNFGEKVVMRLFNKSSRILTFEELGFNIDEKQKITGMLGNANGIIFLAGATGSGKTTSLYTMIDHINSDEINIYTMEDPVEKTIENVTQIQMNIDGGVTYTDTLKALLRQDPDVIVVGETRDSETADLSIRASLTGHLVLTTIHANSAIDTISRLTDMGIEQYLLGASSLGFISQRLIRTLCPKCKQKKESFEEYEIAWIKEIQKEYNIEFPSTENIYKPVGCPHCNKGYKGRTALTETLVATENVKKLITRKVEVDTLKEEAIKEGFKPLKINGITLVEDGKTTIQELMNKI